MQSTSQWKCEIGADGGRSAFVMVGSHHRVIFSILNGKLSLKCLCAKRNTVFKYSDQEYIMSDKSVFDGLLDMLCISPIDSESFLWVTRGIFVSEAIECHWF